MSVSTGLSFTLSSIFSVILFCLMQFFKPWLASSELNTILGGFIGSWLFILTLTAVSNLETVTLGDGFQSRLFPEIILCLIGTVLTCGMIHRVCASTCLIFSLIALYFINRISQNAQNTSVTMADVHISKKKKK